MKPSVTDFFQKVGLQRFQYSRVTSLPGKVSARVSLCFSAEVKESTFVFGNTRLSEKQRQAVKAPAGLGEAGALLEQGRTEENLLALD